MTESLVYKIKTEKGWYGDQNKMDADIANSPIFLNRKRAEKKIRDEISVNQGRVKDWGKNPIQDIPAWWVDALKDWKSARVVAFKLVPKAELPDALPDNSTTKDTK